MIKLARAEPLKRPILTKGGSKMKFSVWLSEKGVNLFDRCIAKLDFWHFDAINSPVLLDQLAYSDCYLEPYLLAEGMDEEDDIHDYTGDFMSYRRDANIISDKKDDESEDKDESKKRGAKRNHEDKDRKLYRSEAYSDVTFDDEKGQMHMYTVNEEVYKIITKAVDICVEKQMPCIEPIHFLSAMFEVEDAILQDLFSELGMNFKFARKYFTSDDVFKLETIPYLLAGFMSCLNDKVNAKKPCEILMRDKEVEQIWNISLKKNKRNTVIVGEAGVGKSAIIEKITYDIVKGTCPERFKNFSVINLDVNALIAGTTFRGQAEERIRQLIKFLEERDNVILFIDEVHTILGAGSCFEGEMDLSNALKPILARGDTIVIGATTDEEYERYFTKDAALSRRFEKVVVEEPVSSKVYPMIKNKIRALSDFHNVKISKSMVEYIVMIAHCFAFKKRNPDKTLDLIDRSMVVAYRNGKKEVDKDCVLANFGIFFELYEGMGEAARKEVAYHEAGHYLIAKLSDKLIEYNLLAVSIMPAEDYLGVTCYEYRKDKVPFTNKEYYIDDIAFSLGGRVAEKLFRKVYTSGACVDLQNAKLRAFQVVSQFGMTANEAEDRNIVFVNSANYPMFSEKTIDMLNSDAQALVDIAKKRAEELIGEHKELLEKIVAELLEKRIMSETELDRICKRYFSKKNK